MATQNPDRRVITPVARLSYPNLFKPSKPTGNQTEGKYQCELIFAPDADLSALKAAASAAAKDKWGANPPKNLKSPFRSGDTDREDKDGYEGNTFIGARSKDRPGVLVMDGREKVPCTNESDIYGGCYVRCSVTAFAYDTDGNRGVSFALNNVLKVADGEPFGSRRSAEEEFASIEVDAEAMADSDLF